MSWIKDAFKRSIVGKKVGPNLYIHPSAFDTLDSDLRDLLINAELLMDEHASEIGVKPPIFTLAKFDSLHDGRVSFLEYEDFDEEAHPALLSSWLVDTDAETVKITDFSKRANRPILHRKETFVDLDYPLWDVFRGLTVREEELGLLSSSRIGFEKQWGELLDAEGLVIEGREVFRI